VVVSTYPDFGADELASFSGRPAESYTEYVETAVDMATLLFKYATCLTEFPEPGTDGAKLAGFAILAMADAIVLSQPYQSIEHSPFASESLGSYSYSKASAQVQAGDPTGVMWFDMAVNQLGVCTTGDDIADGGGIEVFEWDGNFVPGRVTGNVRLLSPAEAERMKYYDAGLPVISKN
jgi:hypothetical protein